MSTYAEKLKDPRWQKKRLEILNRDNWTCQLCGDSKTCLQVHHEKYTREPWNAPDSDLITHCEHCHLLVEALKNSNLPYPLRVLKGQMTENVVTLSVFRADDDEFSITVYDLYLLQKVAKAVLRITEGRLVYALQIIQSLKKSIDGQGPNIPGLL